MTVEYVAALQRSSVLHLSCGHPVFMAQHATATCCGCLAKWHGIQKGHALSHYEHAHVAVLPRGDRTS